MPSRLALAAAALAASAAAAASAHADELSTALDQPLVEISHTVDVAVKDGVATYKVRRAFANGGTVADEARLRIDLPYGAAATGLRIRARDRWYEGELMEAEAAAKLYQELTGRGRWEPKDPALLSWIWADQLRLQIFPVFPGGTSTVEYTLTVPTRYQNGRVFLSYPRGRGTHGLAVPVMTIRPAWGDATTIVKVDGARMAPDTPIVLAPPVVPRWLAAIGPDAGASYASSVIEVEDTLETRRVFTTARVTIDLEHTFKGDVRVALVTPRGDQLDVFDGTGGGDNDVRGTFDVALPTDGKGGGLKGAGTWRLVVSDHAALDAGTLASWTLQLGDGAIVKQSAADTPIFVPDAPEHAADGGTAAIELAPPVIDAVAARFGRVVASKAHAFSRLEVDAAPVLRPLPVKPQVVFAIDASHSVGEAGIASQLAIARAYLAHVPDAEVELVAYRRHAARVFGTFVPAASFEAKLDAARGAGALDPGNGSALDEGARAAAAALVKRKGPLRIVITTDNRLRTRWQNALGLAALAGAPPGTVVHVVENDRNSGADTALTRDDAHDLAPLALAHHGIGATLVGESRAGKKLPAIVLGLVRPVRIDHFAVTGLALDADQRAASVPAVLREGAGFRIVVDAPAAPEKVELTGMIWGDRFRRVVTADAAFSVAAAGWVFSEDDHQDLTPAEMMTVATMGRAVSPVTSYLAIEPGVRPSTIGLETRGTGSGYGVGGARHTLSGRGGGGRVPPDPMAMLADAAKQCVDRHQPAAGWAVTLDMETTSAEVVDVVPVAGEALPVASCLVEAVWALRLTSNFVEPRHTYRLAFR